MCPKYSQRSSPAQKAAEKRNELEKMRLLFGEVFKLQAQALRDKEEETTTRTGT